MKKMTKTSYILKLVYVSKMIKIGVYESASKLDLAEQGSSKIEEFLREEGKHTMMTVKRLDDLGIQPPKKVGKMAERFGETMGKAAGVLGWRGMCFFMQIGEETERLFLAVSSKVCRNNNDREVLNLIIYDEKKHGDWWRRNLSD